MIVMAKLKRRVPYFDEVEPRESLAEDLEALIKAARNEEETEMEDPDSMHDEVNFVRLALWPDLNHYSK